MLKDLEAFAIKDNIVKKGDIHGESEAERVDKVECKVGAMNVLS